MLDLVSNTDAEALEETGNTEWGIPSGSLGWHLPILSLEFAVPIQNFFDLQLLGHFRPEPQTFIAPSRLSLLEYQGNQLL